MGHTVPEVLADGDFLPARSGGRKSQSVNTEGTVVSLYFPEINHVAFVSLHLIFNVK